MIKTITSVLLFVLTVLASAVPLPYYYGMEANNFNMIPRIPIPSNAPLAYISISHPTIYPATTQSSPAKLPTQTAVSTSSTTLITISKPKPTPKYAPPMTNTGSLSNPALNKPGSLGRRTPAPLPLNSPSVTGSRPGPTESPPKPTPRPVSVQSMSHTPPTTAPIPRPTSSINRKKQELYSTPSSNRHGSDEPSLMVSPAATVRPRPDSSLLKKQPTSSSNLKPKKSPKPSASGARTDYRPPKRTKLLTKKPVPTRIPSNASPSLASNSVPSLQSHRRTRKVASTRPNPKTTRALRIRPAHSSVGNTRETLKGSQKRPALRRSPLKYSSVVASRASPKASPVTSPETAASPSQDVRRKCPLLRLGFHLTNLPSYIFVQ